jgi:L-lactate dehydrogenase complex protein LldE
MLRSKMEHVEQSGADVILSGDVSCLTHINGGLEKRGSSMRVKHIADVLAEGIRQEDHESPVQ